MHLLLSGPKRFSDLQKDVGITRRMLTINLRALGDAGLVLRTAYPEVPPRVEYQLTPHGLELRVLINDLYLCGQRFKDRQKTISDIKAITLPAE